MFESLTKFFQPDNAETPDVVSSRDISVAGFENLINIPAATKDDRRFARKMKNADTETITGALHIAIAKGQNWRVWHLLNRPRRVTSGPFFGTLKNLGFEGITQVAPALNAAAAFDNPTAAWLLLKFAEKNPRMPADDSAESKLPAAEQRRAQLEDLTLKALQGAALEKGEKAFALLAHNFAHLAGSHAAGAVHVMAHESNMKQVALAAAASGHHAHLDALHAEKLLTPPQFVEAFMGSFLNDSLFGRDVTAQTRKPFLSWLMNKGFVDETFADQAATVEVRVADAKRFNELARKKGWTESKRTIETGDGQTHAPDEKQVEISRPDSRTGKILTYVFNYGTQAAFLIKGALQNRVPIEKLPEQELVEEGRAFLDSCKPETPELEWKKGEPFRLRLKQQKP